MKSFQMVSASLKPLLSGSGLITIDQPWCYKGPLPQKLS